MVMNIYLRTHRPDWAFNESTAARTSGGVTLRRPSLRVAIVPAIIPSSKQNKKTAKSRRVKTGKTQMKATKTSKTSKSTKAPKAKKTVSFHALRTAALWAMKIDPFSKDALQAVIKKAA
jgi:hypothetical protein